jgi:ferredoxin
MKVLEANKIGELAAALSAAGWRVLLPIEDGNVVRLAPWSPGATVRTDVLPVNSLKDALLPPSEAIVRFALDGDDFIMQETPVDSTRTVALCVRPCDASAVGLLDTIFNWDFPDAFYNARRSAVTIVSLVCTSADEQCFCTTVGGQPDATAGADAIFRPAEAGARLILEPLTGKGRALADAAGAMLADATVAADPAADVPRRFDRPAVTKWLGENFDSPLWLDWSLACLGCGACAFACPTCHCFDIQDETTRSQCVRYRNWDTCALSLFTQHAGGHNPRADQATRRRQRLMHKLSYIPERFGLVGCVGCGRCERVCPAGLGIVEICQAIEETQKVPAR